MSLLIGLTLMGLYLSPPSSLQEGVVELVTKALQQGDQFSARNIWDKIEFPLSSKAFPENEIFLETHWFTEIVHKYQYDFPNESIHCSKQLSEFIHSSVAQKLKAQFYYELKSSSDSKVDFILGKSILKDGVKNAMIVDDQGEKKVLLKFISPVVWTALLKMNFLMQNVKYGSFLYVSGIKTTKEILLWKRQQFINQDQAVFRFDFTEDQNNQMESENAFKLTHMSLSGNKVISNDIIAKPRKNMSSELGIDMQTSSKVEKNSKFWEVDIILNGNIIRIFNHKGNIKEYLCSLNSSYDVDAFRGRAALLSFHENEMNILDDCSWIIQAI